MRHTIMLNLDDAHAYRLDELSEYFLLSAEDTIRFAIRLTHSQIPKRPDVLVPEFEPSSGKSKEETGNECSFE